MFAYCGNKPVVNKDPSGNMDTAALQEAKNWALALVALLDSATPFVETTVLILLGAAVINEYAVSKNEDTVVISDATVILNSQESVYYGVDIVGDSFGKKEWRKQTGPMDDDTAIAWTYATAASGKYGRNANWGLYTTTQADAYEAALALGGAGPCLHENRINEYPHFHVYGMLLFGRYKHFHIWYGDIYEG